MSASELVRTERANDRQFTRETDAGADLGKGLRLARARDNRTNALFLHNLAKIELASAMGVIHKVIQ